MEVYRGTLYTLTSNVPYLVNYCFYENYHYTIDGIDKKLRFSKLLEIEENFGEKIVLKKGTITVLKLPFGRVKSVQIGIVFPTIEIIEQVETDFVCKNNRKGCNHYYYLLLKSNCRLYVEIEEELNKEQVQSFYEDLIEEKIKNEVNRLEQSQHQKSKILSNKQYVKKIEQMRI